MESLRVSRPSFPTRTSDLKVTNPAIEHGYGLEQEAREGAQIRSTLITRMPNLSDEHRKSREELELERRRPTGPAPEQVLSGFEEINP